ncbi:MAG: hypothetical protein IJI37_06290 [Opitutales bacterium]|nr:hypothetical protein [Opitutales bacterium]
MSTPNLIKIGENENLKIDVIAVCGDIYTDGGRLVASGRVIRLNADDVARLGISDMQAIADRYNGRAIDEPEETEE